MRTSREPTTGEKLRHAEWVQEAVRLALKHWSSRRIARKLGLHHSTVAEALARELASRRLSDEQVEAYRNTQRETVFRMLSRWEPRAKTSKDAALVHLKYLERWAKLDGLDAPTRSEMTGASGGPMVFTFADAFPDEQLRSLASDDPGEPGGVEAGGAGGAGAEGEEG